MTVLNTACPRKDKSRGISEISERKADPVSILFLITFRSAVSYKILLYMEGIVLLKNLKILLDTDLKTILDHQNDYVGRSN